MNELDEHIKSALRKEMDFRLPQNFSNKLVELIIAKAKRERRWEIAGIITAGLLFTIALIVTWICTHFKFSLGALTFLSDHIGLISFGIIFILLLHLFDKKIVRKHQAS